MDSYAKKNIMAPDGPLNIMIFIFWLNHLNRLNWTQFIAVKLKSYPKNYQKLFQDVTDYSDDQKTAHTKNHLRRSQFSKKREGGPAGYDHDHRFNGYLFMASLTCFWDRKLFFQKISFFWHFIHDLDNEDNRFREFPNAKPTRTPECKGLYLT